MDSPHHKLTKKSKKQASLSQLKKSQGFHMSSTSKFQDKVENKNQNHNNLIHNSFSQQKQKIYHLHDKVIYQALSTQDFQTSIPMMLELQKKIHSLDYGGNKKLQFYHMSVIYHNLTFAHKRKNNGDLQKCSKLMEKSINFMEFAQAYSRDRQQNITFNIQIIQLMLKQSILLSQVTKHQESIMYAEKALQKITNCFRLLQAICDESIQRDIDSLSSTKQSQLAYSHVNFQRIVLEQAQNSLQQLINLPSPFKLVSQGKKHFQAIIKNIYFWKNNSKNNQKLIRRQLMINSKDINSPRNLLGVQKNYSWVEDFTIGKVVVLKPKKIHKQFNFDKYFLLSHSNILELILYAASCYFTIATQTRFQDEQSQQNELLHLQKKINKQNHNDVILKCKILHLKAIQLAGHYIPYQSLFIQHLISSFNKHYKAVLDQIVEDIAEQSSMRSILFQQGQQHGNNFRSRSKDPKNQKAKQKQQSEQIDYQNIGNRQRQSSGDDYGIKPILKKKNIKTRSRRNSTDQQNKSITRKKRSISNKKPK